MFTHIFYNLTHNNQFYISGSSNLLLDKIKASDAFNT